MLIDKEYKALYENRRLFSYSQGERKYILMKIISYLPIKLLLVDEYLTNLDESHLNEIIEKFNMMIEKGSIIIISSNDVYLKSLLPFKISIKDRGIELLGKS